MQPNARSFSSEDRAVIRRRAALSGGRPQITGTEVSTPRSGEGSGASCVITTDSEGRR